MGRSARIRILSGPESVPDRRRGGIEMDELAKARKEIERIDREMLKLFEERMECSRIIADFKKTNAVSIRDPER